MLLKLKPLCLLTALVLMPLSALAEKTEVGTERTETLIVDMLGGTISSPTQMNPYLQGGGLTAGINQLLFSPLWEIDTSTGQMFPFLAAEMPEVLNDDFTSFRVKIRDGIKWSDGAVWERSELTNAGKSVGSNAKVPSVSLERCLQDKITAVFDSFLHDIQKNDDMKLPTCESTPCLPNSLFIGRR